MSPAMSQLVETLSTVVGTGFFLGLMNRWWDRRQTLDKLLADEKQREADDKKAEREQSAKLSEEERRDAIGILREALTEKKNEHKECLDRVEAVEDMVRTEQTARATERHECAEQIGILRNEVGNLTQIIVTKFGNDPTVRESLPPR